MPEIAIVVPRHLHQRLKRLAELEQETNGFFSIPLKVCKVEDCGEYIASLCLAEGRVTTCRHIQNTCVPETLCFLTCVARARVPVGSL